MEGKTALRARLRAARDAMRGDPLAPPPRFLDRLTPGLVVAAYLPLGGEADPHLFEAAALAADCRLALPHLADRTAPLRFLARPDDAALVAGPFGRQPSAESPAFAPDIILTPLVGFDRHGGRLGQGGGHFDRAFVQWPDAWRVGIAWSVQECQTVPLDPWDLPLHAIATEKEWIEP